MSDKKIFISYSRKDKDAVNQVVNRIEEELGADCCWMDIDGIESGQMFWDVIINAVKNCSVFLLMATDDSMASNNVLGEIQIAKNNSKNIVPVIIDRTVLKNDRFIAHFPINNYILADNPDHMSRLIHDLKNWCHLDSSEHESVPVEVKNPSADVCLKVLSNLDCKVLIDSEEKTVAPADRLTKIPLPVGEYYAEFISTENSSDAISCEIILEHDKLEKIDLLSLKQTREKAEAENGSRGRLTHVGTNTLIPCINNNKFGFADSENQTIIISGKYDCIEPFIDGLARVKIDHYWGFIDQLGREVTPCKYDMVYKFSEGMALVVLNGKYGFIDKSGHEAIPLVYDHANPFSDGLARIRSGKCGFIDMSGREVVPCKYDQADDFSEGLASVGINGKHGFIDKSGREVVPCMYDYAHPFRDDLSRVQLNDKWGFIDKSGRLVTSCKYDKAYDFSDGFAQVCVNDKYGFIDKSGSEIIPCKYADSSRFVDGLARVNSKGLWDKWGYINKSGHEVIQCKYWSARDFCEDLAIVISNGLLGKTGFIDKSGREVVPLKYDHADDFSEGLACVCLNGKCGFIDKYGREIIPCIYDDPRISRWRTNSYIFSEGLACVGLNGKYGCIDKSGRVVVPFKYDVADNFIHGIYSVTLNHKWGYIDRFGNEMWLEE